MGKGGVGIPVPGQNINQVVIKDQKKNLGQSPHLEVEVVRPLGVQPVSELENHLMEDRRVDLFAKLHHDEPVPEAELLHHDGDVAPIGTLRASTEDQVARVLGEDSDQPETEDFIFAFFHFSSFYSLCLKQR